MIEARLVGGPGQDRDGGDVVVLSLPPSLLLLGVDDVLHQLDLLLLPALGRRKQHLQEQEVGINSMKQKLEPIIQICLFINFSRTKRLLRLIYSLELAKAIVFVELR